MRKNLGLTLLMLLSPVYANALVYNEAVDGDLTHMSDTANLQVFDSSLKSVSGVVDLGSDGFIIELQAGESLDSMTLTSAGPGSATFGISSDTTNFTNPSASIAGPFDSWSDANLGDDFLSIFGSGPISAPGSYLFGFWHNNSQFNSFTFDFEFTSNSGPSPVPAPGALPLLILGLAGAIRLRKQSAS